MFVTRVISAILLTTAMSVGMGYSKSIRTIVPAEFPPASFSGKQFVDSKGCMFIRTGSAANVTWYPRVNQKRKPICGQQPTFASAPAPKPTPAPKPAPAVQAPPVKVAVAPKPAPITPTVRSVRAPMEIVASTIARPVVAAPKVAPRPITIAAPRVAPKPPVVVPQRIAGATSPVSPRPVTKRNTFQQITNPCANGSSQYVSRGRSIAVRCGPQLESLSGGRNLSVQTIASPSSFVRRTTSVQSANAPKPTQLALAQRRRTIRYVTPMPLEAVPPAGYVNVWTDGRLNPNRGIGTLIGRAQMNLVWTQTVPRKLIDTRRGIEVTQYYPTVRYPVIPDYGYTIPTSGGQNATTRARISPKDNAAPRRTSTATHRYVQVATFAGHVGASKAATRLSRKGIPVRIHAIKRGGRTVEIVLAGPFKTQSNLQAALRMAKRSGYSSAVLIK